MAHSADPVTSSHASSLRQSPVLWAFILMVGISVRLFALGSIPLGLYMDEVAILLDAKTVSETGMDMHGNSWLQAIFPSYGDYKLPVYIWLASVAVKVLGAHELAVRLPSALAGIGSIVVAGFIVHELLKSYQTKISTQWYVLATSLVLAISPWSILFSRTGFEGHVAQFLVAVSVWIAVKSRKNAAWLLVSIGLGALATYTYFSVRFVWPVVLIGVSGLFLIDWQLAFHYKKKLLLELLVKIVMPLAVFTLLLVPMFNSPWYQASDQYRLSTPSVLNTSDWAVQSNMLRQQAGNQVLDRVFFHRHLLMGRALLSNMADHLSLNYLYLIGDSNLRHGTQYHGLFLLPMLPMLLLGVYHVFDRYRKVLWLLLLWWLIALLPASVPETTPHALRSLNALVPLSILHGFGLGFGAEWVWTNRNIWWVKVAGGGYALAVGVCCICFTSFYFSVYPRLSAESWNQGYRELVTTLTDMQSGEPTFILEFDERFFLWQLLYGTYTAQEIQALPKEGFTPTLLKDVVLITDVAELEPGSTVVVAGEVDDIKKLEADSNGEVLDSQEILHPSGEPLFKVITIRL